MEHDLEFENQMRALSKLTGWEWDGGDDDRLFHPEYPCINCEGITEESYNACFSAAKGFEIKGRGFVAHITVDESGWEYWAKNGANFIMPTCKISDPMNLDFEVLQLALTEAVRFAEELEYKCSMPWEQSAPEMLEALEAALRKVRKYAKGPK